MGGTTHRAEGRPAGQVPAAARLRVEFPGVARVLVLPEDLLDALTLCLKGWKPRVSAIGSAARLDPSKVLAAAARRPDGAYDLWSAHLDEPLLGLSLASAVCAVIADLSQDYSEAGPAALGRHCGAVRQGEGLVLLAGSRRAGKSTLVARLSAEPGVEVFCDDVLPVSPDGQGLAMGIAPRLRLPLPDGASTLFRAHVARHPGPRDDRYGYLPAPALAPHGTSAPIRLLLALDRQEWGPARFHRMDEAEALRLALAQTITGFPSAAAAFEAARRLMEGVACHRLVYSDLEEAVALLRESLTPEGRLAPEVPIGPDLPPLPEEDLGPPPADPEAIFRRSPGVALRRHGEAAFLWRPDDVVLWSLNPVAAAIWAVLEEPSHAADLADLLGEAYPSLPPETLLADVTRLLGGLHGASLIEPVPVGGPDMVRSIGAGRRERRHPRPLDPPRP